MKQHFNDYVFETAEEAAATLDKMWEILENNDMVAVADLKEMVGLESTFEDYRTGWTHLLGAGVRRIFSGHVLNLPQTVDLRHSISAKPTPGPLELKIFVYHETIKEPWLWVGGEDLTGADFDNTIFFFAAQEIIPVDPPCVEEPEPSIWVYEEVDGDGYLVSYESILATFAPSTDILDWLVTENRPNSIFFYAELEVE